MDTLVILIGILASASLIMSGFSTQKKRMLIFAITTSILCVAQFSLTGSAAALVICAIGILRNSTVLLSLKYPSLNTAGTMIMFLVLQTAGFSVVTNWQNFQPITLLPLIGAYAGTVAVFFSKMWMTKAAMIISGITWLSYEYNIGVYGQMIGEAFTLFANLTALTLLLLAERNGISQIDVENVDTQILDVITSSIPVIHDHVHTKPIRIITE
jgi:hypothetical protein